MQHNQEPVANMNAEASFLESDFSQDARRMKQRKKPSLWWYFLGVVLLCILALLGTTIYTTHSYNSFFTENLASIEGLDSADFKMHLELQAREVFYRCLAIGSLVVVVFGVLSFALYRGLEQPLQEMRSGAQRFAEGEFDQRLPSYHLGEIDALARSMDRMGAQLQHLEEVRSDFVANVSHELKTPITSIRGFVETLLDGALDDREDLLRFLDIISKQAERLTQIIDDLLMLSRLESGAMSEQLIVQEEFVRPMLQAAVDLAQDMALAKNITLEIHCANDLKAPFDRSLMEQAVSNLIHNAIKYSGPNGKVELRGLREGSNVLLKVRDWGPGIDTQHLPRLFERFYRVDKARSRAVGGTGLGLSIVKHIASVHGGSVSVHSELAKGSEFVIRL